MVTRVRARCVLPMTAPPVMDGWVDATPTRIVGAGAGGSTGGRALLDLGHAVVLPGLVNAHTHLELSHLRGQVPPAPGFVPWVETLLAARAAMPHPAAAVVSAAVTEAVEAGTAAIADIGNTRAALAALASAPLAAWHFDERLGFRAGLGETVAAAAWAEADDRARACPRRVDMRFGVAPHAPYSTAPDLMAAIVHGLDADPARRSSLHVAESSEEGQFLASGTGPFRDLLERLGVWEPAWTPPATTSVGYLDRLGLLHPRLLLVHGTQCARVDLERLAESGSTLVLCPRSNAWVGVGAPPVAEAFAAGVRVAIGTDSLASVEDLDLFAELAALRRLAPDVPAMDLLRAATLDGAAALGFDGLGAIAPGRASRALIVDLPAAVDGVEAIVEWLVSGDATRARRRWLDDLVVGEAPRDPHDAVGVTPGAEGR